MNTHIYIIIPQGIANVLNNARAGVSQGFARQDKQGRWVTSKNAKNDFPAILNGNFQEVELSVNDFPEPENPDL